jgi:tRNA 2-thiouridine synthesizing protein A
MSEAKLDATGLLCPMPVIRTQDRVASMQAGDLLKIFCTDPGVVNDIPAWCRINGHRVVSIDECEEKIVVTVEVGADQ